MAGYSIGLGLIKTVNRNAYSLLDKVAHFINGYWQLGIRERDVGFLTLWFEPRKKAVPQYIPNFLEAQIGIQDGYGVRPLDEGAQYICTNITHNQCMPA